ncbi:FKBP-type peptidyl-prolyl cis-trans isomerase [Sphingobacterium tabacisoli]|uniref:Peptidyl-prolyl cis-trans isomerase n=1 Tax=Sphingobacterium tabacisoli TaxID=2044855 RepID=A0ABW5KYE1_9SPHI|nr:FKBP-type peptidyl-prolyl cis-trans isomerase [Sphingobacterium tabacisoli]
MKNLFKTVLFAAVGAAVFVSCNSKNEYDIEGERQRILEQEKLIDAQLSKERIEIENYVSNHFTNAIEDTTKYPFQVLDKKNVKRGIWFEVISEPTDDSYEYKLNSNQTNVVFPTWKLKYKVNLLNNETPVQSDLEGSEYNLATGSNSNLFTNAWIISLFPAKYKINGNDINYVGLTAKGQKKGSKIRVIVPSIYAYGSKSQEKIPANSPLVYEFEVLSIQ